MLQSSFHLYDDGRTKPDKGKVGITHAVQKVYTEESSSNPAVLLGNLGKRVSLFPTMKHVDPTGLDRTKTRLFIHHALPSFHDMQTNAEPNTKPLKPEEGKRYVDNTPTNTHFAQSHLNYRYSLCRSLSLSLPCAGPLSM